MSDTDGLLSPWEVARLLGVHPRTVARWADEGRLAESGRSPGGHRRFALPDVEALAQTIAAEGHDDGSAA